jgi:hypothetical protein
MKKVGNKLGLVVFFSNKVLRGGVKVDVLENLDFKKVY